MNTIRYDAKGNVLPDCWKFTEEDLHFLQTKILKPLLDAELWGSGKNLDPIAKETMLKPFRQMAIDIHYRRIALNVKELKQCKKK